MSTAKKIWFFIVSLMTPYPLANGYKNRTGSHMQALPQFIAVHIDLRAQSQTFL